MRKWTLAVALLLTGAVITFGLFVSYRAADSRLTYSSLDDAIRARDKHAVIEFIRSGTSPNQLRADGLHPLYDALSVDDIEIADFLLDAGADTEATLPKDFVNRIVASAQNGEEKSLAWIQQHGVATVEEFLARPEFFEFHAGSYATTPLISAAGNGQLEFLRTLIEHGANLEARATAGFTPMHMAAIQGRPAILRALLESGSQIDSLNDNNETPLSVASGWGQLEAVEVLLDAGANPAHRGEGGFSAMESAALRGQTDILRALAVRGVDVNHRGHAGGTPIYLASMNGHVNAVRFLLESGADPNVRTDSGLTPLHRAAADGNDELVRALLSGGADPALKSPNGNTAAKFAGNSGHDSLANFLDWFDGD